MIYLSQTYEILTGGFYTGSVSWNKKRTEVDNCFKIYQLTEGEVRICDEQQEFTLQKDKTYFINGNKLTRQYCNSSFSTHWLHFIPKDLVVYQGLLSLPLVVELPDVAKEQNVLMPDIEQLQSQSAASCYKYTFELLKLQTFIQAFIIRIFEQYPLDENEQTYNIQRLQPAVRYINKHFTESMNLKMLADLCCLSPNYFHKIFTKLLNTTPNNYIALLRMNASLQLLINDKYTIKEIAYELGFTDDAYFCRVFKKHYGITPGDYKKRRGEVLF